MLVQAGRRPGDPGLGREADARGLDEPGPGRDVRAVCVRGAMRRLDTPAGRQSASTVIRAVSARLRCSKQPVGDVAALTRLGDDADRADAGIQIAVAVAVAPGDPVRAGPAERKRDVHYGASMSVTLRSQAPSPAVIAKSRTSRSERPSSKDHKGQSIENPVPSSSSIHSTGSRKFCGGSTNAAGYSRSTRSASLHLTYRPEEAPHRCRAGPL